MHHSMMAIACGCGLALASTPILAEDDLQALRNQIEQLRQDYEGRLQSLEQRLLAAEEAARRASVQTESSTAGDPAMAVSSGRGAVTQNSFNPAISAVVQTKLGSYSEDPERYTIPGFQSGGESGLAPEGFSLDETELTFSANVDHHFYGEVTVGFHEDEAGTEVDIEEAFFDTLSLPAGTALRVGRFYSGIGYQNRFHPHAWDFHDAPLPYRAMLGDQYGDDGVRFSWLAPTDLYLAVGAELLQGNAFPGGSSAADLGDARTLYAHLGGDLGASNSWRVGLSGLWMDATDRTGGHGHGGDGGSAFDGDSDLAILDLVWKWAPAGNPRVHNFTFQSEFFRRDEQGGVRFTEGTDTALLDYSGRQWGWYAQGVYQFMPRWRVGLRYDRLSADNRLAVLDDGGLDQAEVLEESGLLDEGHDPRRWSLMTDWSPSEFSRVRLQYNRDETRPDITDHQWMLQLIMSLGAHGAHEY